VPKYLPDPQTGAPGDRNGVFATALEHKMGLTASATCELAFGQHGVPAVGWLVGDTHRGIAQMFGIMQYARLMVGIKGIATLSTGYLNALEFAKTRVQGPDLTRMTDKTAPRVPIISHPDVRRSLLTQKAYAEGLRALYLYAAAHQDPVCAHLVSGASPDLAARIHELLLPVVKSAGSERSYACLAESLQVLGGSGYLRDYPIEQYVRDAKIDSLYEGTTGIQAQDFIFRQVIRDGGETLGYLLAQIERFCDGRSSHEQLAAGRVRLAQALGDVRGMLGALVGYAKASSDQPTEVYRVGLRSVPFLLSVADLLIGWLLLWHAEVALDAVNAGTSAHRDDGFYRGKATAAVFFAETVLPRLAADRIVIESQSLAAMELDKDAF
jgi:hypothetical protein